MLEVDLIEERDGKLFAYECKSGHQTAAAPRLWAETYPEAEYSLVNRGNYLEFLVPQ